MNSMMKQMRLQKTQGFTLIEVLIVVAIIGILASIAFPAYQETIRQARRTDAQQALKQLASVMEREYIKENSFAASTAVAGTTGVPTAGFFDLNIPLDSAAVFYNVMINYTDVPPAYTLFAYPVNAMAGDGPIGLSHTGQKGWAEGVANTDNVAAYTSDW